MTTVSSDKEPAEAALRESEERFRMLADNMSQLAWTCDLLGNVTWYNKRWLDYTGLSFEDMKGWDWTKVQHPDHVERVVARVQRAGQTGEPWEDTFPLRGKDGQYRYFLSRAMPIRDEQGNFVQWFGTNTDVTEQKLAEEQVTRQAQELRVLNERLTELDRLKTKFFANVSHEFRTPLTLMLGPLEDALADACGVLPSAAADQLRVSHRNALRLLKLVNTMLDFSRIEAGRLQASYQPTELGTFTAELASNFRSACEKGGLRLVVDCPPLGEPVYVDRDMWEKIVLNLSSNAFKFTLDGEIEVSLGRSDECRVSSERKEEPRATHPSSLATPGCVTLTVRDTGVGIPVEELPQMFERFHRVEHSRGRTHEGTGIGLALVHELVKLHGGTVQVDSVLGEGSTFTVTIPLGTVHLDPQRIGSPSEPAAAGIDSSAFVEEALRWLPDDHREEASEETFSSGLAASDRLSIAVQPHGRRARILWADDNADMRAYVSRLLGRHFDVQAVGDGQAALEAARAKPPDLVLSDIMMPRLDGFGLLIELRADPQLREIPIILLSARAGEENRIEGLEAGADDYLVKPFSARELVAHVGAHLAIARVRKEATEKIHSSEVELRDFVENASVGLHRVSSDGTILWANQTELDLLGYRSEEYIGHSIAEFHVDAALIEDMITRLSRGERVIDCETRMRCKDGSIRHVLVNSSAFFEDGKFIHTRCFTRDITERKRSEQERARLAAIVDSSDDAIISKDLNGVIISWNRAAERLFGYTAKEAVGQPLSILIPVDRLDEEPGILERIRRGERIEHYETVRRRKDGTLLDISLTVSPIVDTQGRVIGASKIARDITDRKLAEEKLRKSEEHLELLNSTVPALISYIGSDQRYRSCNRGYTVWFGLPQDEIVGKPVREVLGEEAWKAIGPHIEAGLSGETVEYEAEVKYRAGGTRWIHALYTPHRDARGNVVGLVVLVTDITNRKQAEDALRQSEERFRNMADSAPNIIWLTDAEGRLTFINRAYLDFLGIGVEEIPSFDWRQIVHLEDRDRYDEAFMAALRERQPFHERVRMRRRDGEWRWLEARGAPIFDHGGNLTGYIGSSPDITDIYESQQALKELGQRKDEFLANMSHEIRSPLTGIMGYADILLDEAERSR